ncbi:TIGR03752 family integrating conjugative element protein [Chitinimonas koreensis]|uniref:TIGR03752 family integrating conjugative element protein n=1 Tax=Chitinimonas koreensis TaxID=356302 RepID=UPI00041C5E43|nr:TIGR03752 family integrating conjugative element protein [Chitinimonas koreensis]QNM96709.1 TIGR03752 family integrating conjugative element protein [Chitinimonas koreensis]
MKSNPLLKWLLIPMVLMLVFVGLKLFSGNSARTAASAPAATPLTPDEMKALGIEGDTPNDTVATLVAQVKQLRGELKTALDDNAQQEAETQRLRERETAVDQRIQAALEGERERLQQEREQVSGEREQTEGLLQDLQRRLDGLSSKSGQGADLPIGLGLEEGDGKDFGRSGAVGGMRWVEPDDMRSDASRTSGSVPSAFPTSFGPAQQNLAAAAESVTDAGSRVVGALSKPVYTVPANSTLMGSIAMTALIGRVPIDGTVNDPYPFKVLIGPDNLTANGIDLPDVAGAVVSGTASGDWTLSCVRGQIRSVTFVFADGTIRTVPEARGNANGGDNQSDASGAGIRGGLGWISDPHGVPCVSGERRSNAQQYLGTQALITAAGAGAASLIQSDNGSVAVVGNGSGALGTVGISGNEAVGRVLASGVSDMADWVNKLYGQAFAAIYVPPGARVAVHLEQALNIDYDAHGRRVQHRTGAPYASDLD